MDNNKIKDKKVVFVSIFIGIILTYILIIGVYFLQKVVQKKQINDAKQQVTDYLYDKYGNDKISAVEFYQKKKFDICDTFFEYDNDYRTGYVFKYYSNSYIGETFYITLWKSTKKGKTKIEEVNGSKGSYTDNCDTSYPEGSLESRSKK